MFFSLTGNWLDAKKCQFYWKIEFDFNKWSLQFTRTHSLIFMKSLTTIHSSVAEGNIKSETNQFRSRKSCMAFKGSTVGGSFKNNFI